MCEYAEIENIKLSNGKTIKQVNEEVGKEVERILSMVIYLHSIYAMNIQNGKSVG